jgi:hypothetical protein
MTPDSMIPDSVIPDSTIPHIQPSKDSSNPKPGRATRRCEAKMVKEARRASTSENLTNVHSHGLKINGEFCSPREMRVTRNEGAIWGGEREIESAVPHSCRQSKRPKTLNQPIIVFWSPLLVSSLRFCRLLSSALVLCLSASVCLSAQFLSF